MDNCFQLQRPVYHLVLNSIQPTLSLVSEPCPLSTLRDFFLFLSVTKNGLSYVRTIKAPFGLAPQPAQKLTGTIPNLSFVSELVEMNLQGNALTGIIPNINGNSNLRILYAMPSWRDCWSFYSQVCDLQESERQPVYWNHSKSGR